MWTTTLTCSNSAISKVKSCTKLNTLLTDRLQPHVVEVLKMLCTSENILQYPCTFESCHAPATSSSVTALYYIVSTSNYYILYRNCSSLL